MLNGLRNWPWLTLQIIAANVAVILSLAIAWYLVFSSQSSVYSDRLMSTFNIEPGKLHAMFVEDVERQLWFSVILGLILAIIASVSLAFLIGRPLRSLASGTERLRHGDYSVRSHVATGEVGLLAENFNALAAALEQEEKRRAQFMADLGHELRTPIMSLRGYTEGLEDGIFDADDHYFNLMAGELKHLTALTHTIETMRLDHVDNHPAEKTPVGVVELLENSKHRWDTRFSQRELHLEVDIHKSLTDIEIAAPGQSLQQIVDNLLSNMLRYASVDGPCRIDVRSGTTPNRVELTFSNPAPDIKEEFLPFLFDRLYRVSDSRTRIDHEQPSGLGLSVVKQLCMVNQGSVVASLNGTRLSIIVLLPLRRSTSTYQAT